MRKEKIEKDIKKVDVRSLEIRAIKPAHNSHREVLSARRSTKRTKPAHNSHREVLSDRQSTKRKEPVRRSRSANRMETDEFAFNYIEDVFN